MKFLKLEIQNLASLDRAGGETINFDEGALGNSTIFSIVGPTGSGKSTILDAICLALYNRAPRYPRKKGDRNQGIEIYGEPEEGERNRLAPTDPRNILTRGKKEGYSKLTFLANNDCVYRAEWHACFRVRAYGDATTALYAITEKDGVVTEEEAEWESLPQIIGLDYEQFLRTVLIAQGSFANFLTAKENERYELLEKLIGCEELYTNIAAKIKQQKADAVHAYDQIVANMSANEDDIIPESELQAFQDRLKELIAEEQKTKAELKSLEESLEWYTADEKLIKNIENYKSKLIIASEALNAAKGDIDRLNLYDATHDAVNLYKGIKDAEEKIEGYNRTLKELKEKIGAEETRIGEEEQKLVNLRSEVDKASETFEKQKPHIIKAREIKVKLDSVQKTVVEKEHVKTDAEKAKDKAVADLRKNEDDIKKAEANLQKAQDEKQKLEADIETRAKLLRQKANEAEEAFSAKNKRLEGQDANKLQQAKSEAEKIQNDLKEAIRIQDELAEKRKSLQSDTELQQKLTARNAEINEELKELNVEELKGELETLKKSYTLMTSENWAQHRNELREGEACPLCGATHHPYQNAEAVAPVINDMKQIVDHKELTLKGIINKQDNLTREQSRNIGELNTIEKALEKLSHDIALRVDDWKPIHDVHADWPENAEQLRGMQAEIDNNASQAAQALMLYNDLVKQVEQLRKAKESAEDEERKHSEEATGKRQVADKQVTDAHTTLATEKGKTDNLVAQQAEKIELLSQAVEASNAANKEVAALAEALKAEIGDKDSDAYENQLSKAKDDAVKAVDEKENYVGELRAKLEGFKGSMTTTEGQLNSETKNLSQKQGSLTGWLAAYNGKEDRLQTLAVDDIAALCQANDDWEALRLQHDKLKKDLTAAETTLNNEQNEHKDHQAKKPGQTKEKIEERKAELESRSNDERINAEARLQRHDTAKQKMGSLFDEKQKAETLKNEWEQIADAIGADGKTLRKIAQCYTLRFLIEHANVEIKKFNSRYELQQVKNSLGMRIIDHDRADDIRDTTSLSGGETFIVSLGLALGLSSLSSNHISFENIFIDEGFGTLDPDTLATVIDSLARLQSSQGKKVGVISHTDTMSERITTQIRVIKNGDSGSSHLEIYP